MFEIAAERPEDAATIDRLLDHAFGPDRHARTSYRYREGVDPERRLCLVARDGGGRIVGSIRHWPVMIGANDAAAAPALLLGPLAVAAEHRGQGVGRALMRRSLETAAAAGHRIVLLVGDLAYYRRFGFEPAPPAVVMPAERPDRLLATELAPGALAGVSGAVRCAADAAGRCLRRLPLAAPARGASDHLGRGKKPASSPSSRYHSTSAWSSAEIGSGAPSSRTSP